MNNCINILEASDMAEGAAQATVTILMKKITLISTICVVLHSCSPSNEFEQLSVRTVSLQDLSGTYIDQSTDSTAGSVQSLWQIFYKREEENSMHESYIVALNASKKMITFSFMHNGNLVKTATLKGHFKDGYFVNRKSEASGIYGILWRLDNTKLYVGLTKEGRLIIVTALSSTGFLTLLPLPLTSYDEARQFERAR